MKRLLSSPHAPALIFLGIITIFLFREIVLQGRAFASSMDVVTLDAPTHYLAADSLAKGRLPHWNPHLFCGVRGLGDPILRSLYPVNFIINKFFSGHIPLLLSLRRMLETFLLLTFSYFFFLKVWKERKLALFSSVTFALSTWSMFSATQGTPFGSFVYAPLILWILWDWPERGFAKNTLLLTLALALEISAGFHQMTTYFIGFSFIFALARCHFKAIGQFLLLWFSASALALMLNSIEIFPFLEMSRQSSRPPVSFDSYLQTTHPWYSVLRILMPFFLGDYSNFSRAKDIIYYGESFIGYAGVAAFFFCLIAASRLRKRRDVLVWSAMILCVTLMTLHTPLARIPYELFLRAPISPGRTSVLVALMMAFLAPIGIRLFLEGDGKFRARASAFVLSFSAIVYASAAGALGPLSLERLLPMDTFNLQGSFYDLPSRFKDAAWPVLLAGSALSAWMWLYHKAKISAKVFQIGIVLLLTGDLCYFARRHTLELYFLQESLWYPHNEAIEFISRLPYREKYRIYTDPFPITGAPPPFDYFWFNYNMVYGWRDAGGYANFLNARYAELAAPAQKAEHRLPRYSIRTAAMADLLSIRYFIMPNTPKAVETVSSFAKPIAASEDLVILEKPDALPRIRLACRVMEAQNAQQVRELAHRPDIRLKETVFAQPGQPWKYDWSASGCLSPQSSLEILEEYGGYLKARVKSPTPVLLLYTESWDPGWRAKVNAHPERVHRVNWAFQAVELDAGESLVELRYRSPSYPLALALTVAAALIVAGLGFPLLIRK